ncbi:MAG: HAD family hydrolase [Spirochaetes bacterium]|nr:HAD family hydrolase [Spirochaetota bacterium]
MTYLAFDLDGTIYDCRSIIVQAFQQGIADLIESGHNDIGVPGKGKIVAVLGTPHDLIFVNLFPELKSAEQEKINDYCTKALVRMVNSGGGEIFEGVKSTLKKLYSENYRMFIASNGHITYIEAILNSNELSIYFSKPILSLNKDIPDKSAIVECYKNNLCNDDLLIMIGDRESDKTAARDNDIPFIGCSFGHADYAELQGSRWIVHEFSEIFNCVKEIELEIKK